VKDFKQKSRKHFSINKIWSSFASAGLDVPPPVGGRRSGLRPSLAEALFACVDVKPSCRAVGADGEATTGKELLDGNDRYGQILQW
jgi:hypothetical protein